MANKIVIRNNASKMLSRALKVIEKVKKEDLKEIAEKCVETAKDTLSLTITNPDFTQKHEFDLVNEIGYLKTAPNEYSIIAPLSNNPEIELEMYYAEYGAGIGTSKERSIRPKTNYVRTGGTTKKGGETFKPPSGYWFYPLIGKEWVEYKVDKLGRPRRKVHDRWGYTNTSEPANYMFEARETAKKEFKKLGEKVEQRIKTNIKRYKPNIKK